MWKYIVTWTLWVAVPCQEPDEFGRTPLVHPDVYCDQPIEKRKEFKDRKKAIEFHDIGNYNKPLSMTIDSIKIKEQ